MASLLCPLLVELRVDDVSPTSDSPINIAHLGTRALDNIHPREIRPYEYIIMIFLF